MGRLWRRALLLTTLIAGATCGVALSRVALWNFHLKRFTVVQEDVLYRSAQPTEHGFEVLVEHLGVRTIACLRRENSAVRRNLLDLDEASGVEEDAVVARLGAQHLHWPMGGEAYWPWFSPEQFEAFFELMDDPGNFPVAVHCIGGRHRTGTFVALYRLEYPRWSVEDALREMYSYEFGEPVPIQDHNLRTYLPRPLPRAAEWAALQDALGEVLDRPWAKHSCSPGRHECLPYATFIRRMRQARSRPEVEQALESYVRASRPFSLCLAHRVIDQPSDPLAKIACDQATDCLRRNDAASIDWAIAAALLADFGEPAQQQDLLALLSNEPRTGIPSPRYQAIVRGVTNRYTANRIAFLRPILDDVRPRVEPEAVHRPAAEYQPYRYCDTAVARLSTILDRYSVVGPTCWEESRQDFLQWFADHKEACRPGRLGERRFNFSHERKTNEEDRDDYR